MKSRCLLAFVVWVGMAPCLGHAQIYRCMSPEGKPVYSDRKCDVPEKRETVRVTDNLMDGIGSTRDADRHALQVARLKSTQTPSVDGIEGAYSGKYIADKARRPLRPDEQKMQPWTGDGEGESFVVYPFMGRVMELKPADNVSQDKP